MATTGLMNIRGVGKATADKLNHSGLTTVEAVAGASIADLVTATGFGDARVTAIKQSAKELVAAAATPAVTESTSAGVGCEDPDDGMEILEDDFFDDETVDSEGNVEERAKDDKKPKSKKKLKDGKGKKKGKAEKKDKNKKKSKSKDDKKGKNDKKGKGKKGKGKDGKGKDGRGKDKGQKKRGKKKK